MLCIEVSQHFDAQTMDASEYIQSFAYNKSLMPNETIDDIDEASAKVSSEEEHASTSFDDSDYAAIETQPAFNGQHTLPEIIETHFLDSWHEKLSPNTTIVFDTETSGFTGVVIQFACLLIDTEGVELSAYNQYWKLIGHSKIDLRAQQVHRITSAYLDQYGIEPAPELRALDRLFRCAHVQKCRIVAHNAVFDVGRIRHTSELCGIASVLSIDNVFCTMKNSYDRSTAKRKDGKKKFPRNDELYEQIVGKLPTFDLHDALNDTRVTAIAYIRAKELNWW